MRHLSRLKSKKPTWAWTLKGIILLSSNEMWRLDEIMIKHLNFL